MIPSASFRLLTQDNTIPGNKKDGFRFHHLIFIIAVTPIYPCIVQDGVENPAGRADEGFSGEILLVARLFADKNDFWVGRSLAENNLRGVAP